MKLLYPSLLTVLIAGCGTSNTSSLPQERTNQIQPQRESLKISENHCPEISGTYSCSSASGGFDGTYVFSYTRGPATDQSTYQITPPRKSSVTYVVSPQMTRDGRCRDGELLTFIQGTNHGSAYGFGAWQGNGNSFDLQINYYEGQNSAFAAACKKQKP